MKRIVLIPFLSFMLLGYAGRASGSGPASDPQAWPDYGGTPDVAAPRGMGLSVDEIRRILTRLKSVERSERTEACEELRKNAPGSESAFREALWEGHGARNAEMKQALRDARKRVENSSEDNALLNGLLLLEPADSASGAGAYAALRIYAMLNALNELDTMAAYKVMIDFSPRHAGLFRQEIGRMLVVHGLDALPALIYGRGHADEETHMFAVKWIRDMGDPLLSEQVGMKNFRRLAQLLEAYASVNELDTIDVTLALTNHESAFVRAAARSCMAVYNINAKWPVRRLYENTFGEEPSEDTAVDKLLNKIYAYFDHRRLAGTTEVYSKGVQAFKSGRLDEMAGIFRDVLRDEPMFPLKHEMAEGFLARAEQLQRLERPLEAEQDLLLAYRIAQPRSVWAERAEARLKWIEVRRLQEKGILVLDSCAQALKGDPENMEAEKLLDAFVGSKAVSNALYLKSAIISLFIFLAGVLTYMKLR